ncbi:probable ATP-dependent DNA helicase HFM1 isoform X1 [Gambusia affinis]|uniref:probable ATP-dependent DNA helicase HFM1 isoform X1 n=1 Tax=Gambusia affinis TaxID=33528 RepID=UPI001CDCA2DD|nr:probable ATP-dependent DNA helicase HFM1 isoform X1 [Gambusia affinis]XP_043988991.1 probable ATP-dependent DNA helicase HFM1 isoform X1 [Gambusia affinis]
MFDADDCTLSLDSLFFEKPTVHKVKPLHLEGSQWQLDAPPPLAHIPATQDMQQEAESLSALYSFTQKPKMFQPPFKGINASSSKINSFYSFNDEERRFEETQGDCVSNLRGNNGCSGNDGLKDYPKGSFLSGRGGDETRLDSCHAAVSRCLPGLPLRRSLFRSPALSGAGDLSTNIDLQSRSGNGGGGGEKTSRPQTFLSPVAMATVPPALQLPQAAVGKAAPPFSATSMRPLQQAQHAETPDKGVKRAFVPPMTPQPLHVQGSSGSEVLRPVSEIPVKFRSIFSEFPFFNYVQSKALDDVLYTNKNFVACAPTGSGKTVLFELAIIRLLMETQEPWRDVKAVYMAPIKALCSQCYDSWTKKFGPLGLTCKELTGDTEIDDLFEIHDSHIILTTPEKWDSMTRKWKDNSLLQLVRLFLIDEVHVVKDATRGATLEVVVSRMKAVNSYRTSQNPEAGVTMRLVAVSATIPNICDIADWLSNGNEPASYLSMDESHRPVKLRKVVLGFPCSGTQTEFKFDLSLNYKMTNIIQTYSDQKPTLVFCSTRKGAQQSAAVLAKDARFIMSFEHKQRLMKYANSILDSKLRDLMMLGVGYHHAGVDLSDRKQVEESFTLGDLPVLFTTRTLAMGVNLPAHLVVIKSTMQYVAGSCEEYSEADILQMIGRAGRPQFDTSATAVIMTKVHTREKYMKLMNGIEIIESSLHSHLVEHLNAEIVLQTISDVNMALDWIRSTFLYIRALKNPSHYGFSTNLDRYGIEAKLQELCLKNLNSLSAIDLITMDEDINIKPTEAGRLMARYCVAFETMQLFSRVTGTETLPDLVDLVSKSKEFRDVQLRVNEKKPLNTLNRDKNRATIRFPLEGKIKTSEMKVNCLIQAQLSSISIQDFGLTQETAKIFRIGMRISKCLSEFLTQQSKTGFCAALNSLILAKCFRAKLWENSPFVSKQMEKIGLTLSTAMVNAGLTSFSKIEQTNPRELELILNRHPPFGSQIRESVVHLPKYDINLEQLPRYSSATAEIVVKVTLQNQTQLLSRRTAPDHHYVSLIIGNSENHVVIFHKLKDSLLLKSGSWTKKIDVPKASKGNEISVNLISSEYVGLDIQLKFPVYYSAAAQNLGTEIPQSKTDNLVGQRAQRSHCAEIQKTSSAKKQGNNSASKRQCNHFCKNKNLCAHDCCKVGVAVGQKRSVNYESSFSSYLEDLRNRSDVLAQTPVKRLKIKMSEEPLSVNMKRFAYKPRETLPSGSWHAGNEYKNEDMELTAEHYAELPDVICLEDFDRDYRFHAEDRPEGMAETSQTSPAAPAYHQNSSKWMTLKSGSGSRSPPNQISTVSSASSGWSTAVPEQKKPYKSPSSLQIPTVTFDLGNEWDDWRDFDDENLLNASETSPPQCTSSCQPQMQQHVQNKISAPELICSSQAEPCMTTFTTSLRSISHPNPEIGKVGPSSISQSFASQKRIALHWDTQRPNVFSDVFNGKTPEKFPAHTLGGQVSRRLNFFSTLNPTSSADLPLHKSTEEEAFLGIFDGIF